MSEETFRIVMAASVLPAVSALVVQAVLAMALYGVVRTMKRDTAGFLAKLGPAFGKVGPLFNQVEVVIEKTELVMNSLSSTAAKLRSDWRNLVEETTRVSREAEVLMRSLSLAAATSHQIVQDLRPRVADVSGEVRAIVRSGRTQVEDVRGLLHDAGDRFRCRLDQIDHAVNQTVHSFERVSNAVLRPVHKVRRIAAGVYAGAAAFVRSAARQRGTAQSQLFPTQYRRNS
jgi:methyl-accepting chemotaxis protein